MSQASTIGNTDSSFQAIVPDGGELGGRYLTDTAMRTSILQTACLCVAHTWPFLLPQPGQSNMGRMPESHQSIGARGLTNWVGKALSVYYPADAPFARFVPAPKIMYDPQVPEKVKQDLTEALYADTLTLMALMEGAYLDDESGRHKRPISFRGRMGYSMAQLFATGDTLERMTPDFRVQVYRRDQYVTRRDSCGDVLYHGVIELVDPMDELTENERVKCKLPKDALLKKKPTAERMRPITTFCDWEPWSKKWVTRQEVNGVIFNTTEDPVSPFCSVPMHLVGGEHYGRGLVETSWLPDLRSYNTIMLRLLEWAALAAKKNPVIDPTSELTEEDLKTESGMPIYGRVKDGKAVDIGWTGVDALADFKVVESVGQRLYADLAKSMLIESEVTPSKERTTAYQVSRIAAEIDGATGGNGESIGEESHVPKIRYFAHQARLKGILPTPAKAKDRHIKIEILSGMAAIARQNKVQDVLEIVDVLSRLGPEGASEIDVGVLADVLTRYRNVNEPGLIKSPEKKAAELKAAEASQIRQQAAQQAIQSSGSIAENALAQAA